MKPKSPTQRVVVTGFGAVTPLGSDARSSWKRLVAGEDGIAPLTLFDIEGSRCSDAAAATLPALPGLSAKKLSRLPRASRLAIPAAAEALGQAGLLDSNGRCAAGHLPLSVATSAGGMLFGEEFLRLALKGRKRGGQLMRVGRYQPQQQIRDLQESLGLSGPTTVIANACASGANGIGHGADLIRSGMAECVLAGGYEALSELLYVGFDCIHAMTAEKCRPFDRGRSGLILGEAAAFFVLESETSARKRGARILCELSGYGHTTDLHHLTQPDPGGGALVLAMEQAVAQAKRPRKQIAYVNAHGTGTVLNDAAEAAAFKKFFGKEMGAVRISSTKAAIGHTLGAAGAVEAMFCVQALASGRFPPQINLRDPEPEMAPALAKPGELGAAESVMSVNLGFGGSNAALLFSKWQ